jgi:WD40 repeat protein
MYKKIKTKITLTASSIFLSIFLFTYCNWEGEENIYIDDPLPYPYRASVTSINENTLKVEWYDVLSYCNDCYYQIERAVDNGEFVVLQNQIRDNYFYDYDVEATKRYSYKIKSYNKEKSSGDMQIRVRFDFANELKKTINFPQSGNLLLSHNKQLLAATSKNIISVWDANSWKLINTIEGQGEFVYDLHFSSDDSKLIFSIDSLINIADINNGTILHSIALPRDCYQFTFNTDLSKILTYSFFRFHIIMYIILIAIIIMEICYGV